MATPRKKSPRTAAGGARKAKPGKLAIEVPALASAVNAWVKAKAAIAQAEDAMSDAEAAILPRAEEARLQACLATGEYQPTVVVNGKVSITQSKRCRSIPAEDLPSLRKVFGDETERMFSVRTSIKLKEEVLESSEALEAFMEAIGRDALRKWFDVTKTVEATEAFHVERSTQADTSTKAREAIEEGLVVPAKATLRLAKG